MELLVPGNLKQLSEEEIAAKTTDPSQRPTFVFEEKEKEIKLAINYGSSPAKDQNLPEIKAFFETQYSKFAGRPVLGELKPFHQKKIILFQFELHDSHRVGRITNFIFIATVAVKLLMVDYSYPTELAKVENKKATAILNSLEVRE